MTPSDAPDTRTSHDDVRRFLADPVVDELVAEIGARVGSRVDAGADLSLVLHLFSQAGVTADEVLDSWIDATLVAHRGAELVLLTRREEGALAAHLKRTRVPRAATHAKDLRRLLAESRAALGS